MTIERIVCQAKARPRCFSRRRAFWGRGRPSERFGLEQLDLLAVRPLAEGVAHRYGRIAFEYHVGRLLGDGAACGACLLRGLVAVAGSEGEMEDGTLRLLAAP